MEEKPQPAVKEITVEIPQEVVEEAVSEVEKKPAPKRKIVFKKK